MDSPEILYEHILITGCFKIQFPDCNGLKETAHDDMIQCVLTEGFKGL